MHLHIPTLVTTRLELVPIASSHLDAYVSIYGDPTVTAHLSGPMDRADIWKLMARHAGQWVLKGCGGWSVKQRGKNEVIGVSGIQYLDGKPDEEIGWVFHPDAWGKGYATEAASAVLSYAFHEVGANRVRARIAPANIGSVTVAHKLGMMLDPALSTDTTLIYVAERP
jgi:RimJ/RimL family protein N-acetyltransferase